MTKNLPYTREMCMEIARSYTSRTAFRLENTSLYKWAQRRGLWPEISRHMIIGVKGPAKWDKEAIVAAARSCHEKKVFQKRFSGAYAAAAKMGILVEVCSHMQRRLLPVERVNGRICSMCDKFTRPEDIVGSSAICRSCNSERTSKYARENPAWKAFTVAKRRAALKNAIPSWVTPAEQKKMRDLYKLAKSLSEETGTPHEVDHIYPLQSRIMCGLHVPENLQVVTRSHNRKKSNKVLEQ